MRIHQLAAMILCGALIGCTGREDPPVTADAAGGGENGSEDPGPIDMDDSSTSGLDAGDGTDGESEDTSGDQDTTGEDTTDQDTTSEQPNPPCTVGSSKIPCVVGSTNAN
jgi:hypothetical protein